MYDKIIIEWMVKMRLTSITLLIVFYFFYMLSLAFIYFRKKRINNEENKVYTWLICLNIFGLFIQLGCEFVSTNLSNVPIIISGFFFRSIIVYFFAFINTLLDYIIAICYKSRKIIRINILLTIIECLISLFLPYNFNNDSILNLSYLE